MNGLGHHRTFVTQTMNTRRPLALSLVTALALAGCRREAPPPPQSAGNNPVTPAAVFSVQSPARSTLIAAGEESPRFRVTAHDGRVIENTGVRQRPLVVYFYPRDETPGCTVEAHGFRDHSREFEAAGVDVVGVSTDSNDRHRSFASGHSLGFALVSDPEGKLASAFGVGVRLGFAQRVTIIIAKSGLVAKVFESVTPDGHAEEVLTAVRAAAQ
jgi:peroxiredoxin Q/BCP